MKTKKKKYHIKHVKNKTKIIKTRKYKKKTTKVNKKTTRKYKKKTTKVNKKTTRKYKKKTTKVNKKTTRKFIKKRSKVKEGGGRMVGQPQETAKVRKSKFHKQAKMFLLSTDEGIDVDYHLNNLKRPYSQRKEKQNKYKTRRTELINELKEGKKNESSVKKELKRILDNLKIRQEKDIKAPSAPISLWVDFFFDELEDAIKESYFSNLKSSLKKGYSNFKSGMKDLGKGAAGIAKGFATGAMGIPGSVGSFFSDMSKKEPLTQEEEMKEFLKLLFKDEQDEDIRKDLALNSKMSENDKKMKKKLKKEVEKLNKQIELINKYIPIQKNLNQISKKTTGEEKKEQEIKEEEKEKAGKKEEEKEEKKEEKKEEEKEEEAASAGKKEADFYYRPRNIDLIKRKLLKYIIKNIDKGKEESLTIFNKKNVLFCNKTIQTIEEKLDLSPCTLYEPLLYKMSYGGSSRYLHTPVKNKFNDIIDDIKKHIKNFLEEHKKMEKYFIEKKESDPKKKYEEMLENKMQELQDKQKEIKNLNKTLMQQIDTAAGNIKKREKEAEEKAATKASEAAKAAKASDAKASDAKAAKASEAKTAAPAAKAAAPAAPAASAAKKQQQQKPAAKAYDKNRRTMKPIGMDDHRIV